LIESVYEIGYYLKEKRQADTLEMFLEPLPLTANSKIIVLLFSIDEVATLENITIEDFDRVKERRYLFQTGESNGCNISPLAKITKITKTFNSKILKWFKQNSDAGPYSKKINDFFKKSKENNKLAELHKKLLQMASNLNSKLTHLITIKIKKDGREFYIGDFEEFRKRFLFNATNRLSFQKTKGKSEGDGYCIICNKRKLLLGFSFPFLFYNVDQRGFAYDLQQKNSWKQLPLCFDCSLILRYGKYFLDEKLIFNFYTFNYYFIPKTIFKEIEGEILSDIESFFFSDKKKYQEGPLKNEDKWQEALLKRGDSLSLIFLFFKKKQNRVIIYQYVEDVPPSWLNLLLSSFSSIAKNKAIFKEEALKAVLGDNAEIDFRTSAAEIWGTPITIWSLVREFYPSDKKIGIFDKYFIDVVGNILKRDKLNEKFLLKAINYKLKQTLNENKGQLSWKLSFNILEALLFHDFLIENDLLLGDICMHKDEIFTNEILSKNYMKRIKKFFDEHAKALNTYEKKAVFLQGVLTRFLFAIQFSNLGSNPFMTRLFGLQLDRRKLAKIFPQVIAKLREYNISYAELEELIAKYYLALDESNWHLTADETSYYFTMGLILGSSFRKDLQEE